MKRRSNWLAALLVAYAATSFIGTPRVLSSRISQLARYDGVELEPHPEDVDHCSAESTLAVPVLPGVIVIHEDVLYRPLYGWNRTYVSLWWGFGDAEIFSFTHSVN